MNASASERFWKQWNAHKSFLRHYCKRWIDEQATEIDEILSGAMVHAWEGFQNAPEIGNHTAWLVRVVRNYCVDQLRKQNRNPQISFDPELLTPISEQQKEGQMASVEANAMKEESYQALLTRIEKLPLPLREVMMLRTYQDMKYGEIATHLQITSETARKRVESARRILLRPDRQVAASKNLEEQAAVDDILAQDRFADFPSAGFAAPVRMLFADGYFAEIPVFHHLRPQRLEQKAETLRGYLERHPKGWKKELEYARLCWALGDVTTALAQFANLFERFPALPAVAYPYLDLLRTVGQSESVATVARETLAAMDSKAGPWETLFLGFAWEAEGFPEEAVNHFLAATQLSFIAHLKVAEIWIRLGLRSSAIDLLHDHLRRFPMDREAHFWMAIALVGSPKARSFARDANARFPQDVYAMANHLVAELPFADPNDTTLPDLKPLLHRIQKLAPDSLLALGCKMAWFERFGLPQKAERLFDDFLKDSPNHIQALQIAAALAHRQGRMTDVLAYKTRMDALQLQSNEFQLGILAMFFPNESSGLPTL